MLKQKDQDTTDNRQTDQPGQTPLEMVKQQQAMLQESHEVTEQRPENSPEVPGASNPPTAANIHNVRCTAAAARTTPDLQGPILAR